MATTSKTKDGALGKDKKSMSPSNSQTTSTHSQRGSRAIPNYLKPTMSSHNESLKLGKKNNNNNINNNNSHEDDNNQKLLRRRSFDKPPSASPRGQRALISPGPRDRAGSAPAPLVPRERKITVRSSSFGRHSVTTTKTVADHPRVLKSPKGVRSLPVGSKPTRTKSSPLIDKKESSNDNASASRKSSSTHEAKQEAKEGLVKEVKEVVNKVESETSELGADISVQESETEEDVDHVVETEEDDKIINPCDMSSTCASEDQSLIQETDGTDQEDKLHDQVKADAARQERDPDKENEETRGGDGIPEETVIGEVKAKTSKDEIEEKDEDHNKNSSESVEDDDHDHDDGNKVEEEKLEVGPEEAAASEGIKGKEGGEGEVESKRDGEAGTPKVVVSKVHERPGKKESPSAAYNDVIEETASKLLEKRKNKVRALVGAFETVIDYESAASSK